MSNGWDDYVRFTDEVSHEISIAELAATMTEGQKVHMANHLWKHYEIGPQKLVAQTLDPEPDKHIVLNGYVYTIIGAEGE